MKYKAIVLLSASSFAIAGCGPRLVEVVPNGSVLPDYSADVVADAAAAGSAEQQRIHSERAGIEGAAMSSCAGAICDAIGRGELMIGMTEAEVFAATRTTADAWDVRSAASALTLSPSAYAGGPADAVAPIAFVNFQNGRVASYTYREAQGFRTVASPADASATGRMASRASTLVEEGDRYAAAGRLDLALQRYDQADVIYPGQPDTNLRIASTLDKQLRPLEAVMRYQLFLHQMELELIDAKGDAAAKIAEAIARAHERIVVLDRR